MLSDQQVRNLEDILASIDTIQQFTLGMTIEAFASDQRTRLAVERLLQNLTEAAHRLGRDAPAICPDVDRREVRNFGNFLRHEYDRVLSKSVWSTVIEDLPPLPTAITRALGEPS